LLAVAAEDELVLLRVASDDVMEDLRHVLLVAGRHGAELGVARVVELLAARKPRDRGVARARDLVFEVLPRRDVADEERALFAAALARAPGDLGAVPRR